MTDTNTPSQVRDSAIGSALNQRPSFTRWNDPIGRLAFLAHWLLSLALCIVLPFAVFWLSMKLAIGAVALLLTFIALLPAVHLYWVSSQRRLLDIGANEGWLILIFVFLAVCGFNALDSVMRSGMAGANAPTINPIINGLLLWPAIVLHFVLLLRRGKSALHRPSALETE